jgi:hypothetical protein
MERQLAGLNTLPSIPANPTNTITCRYSGLIQVQNAEYVTTINAQELIFAPGAVALSSSTYAQFANSIKVKEVDVWVNPTFAQGSGGFGNTAPISAGIIWYSSVANAAAQTASMSTSLSTATPCHAHSVPPSTSLCSFWFNEVGNAPMFDIVLQTGNNTGTTFDLYVVIDIKLNWIASNQSYAVLTKSTTSTIVAGNVVYPPLDGPGGNFLRLGLPSIL